MSKIDLHAHSNRSDGKESVTTVFEEAAAAGVSILALTDHDTTSGWDEAAAAAGRLGIGFVPGIELSTRAHVQGADGETRSFGVHMLAYLPNPKHPELAAAMESTLAGRIERLRIMTEMISEEWYVEWEDVLAQLEAGATYGRPALADALIKRGHFAERGQVFDEVWAEGRDYYVPYKGAPDTYEAIELIRAAGGVPVIAHPMARGKGVPADGKPPIAHFEEMIARGLGGFEVYHRDVPDFARDWLVGLAQERGLVLTGSSDYHGKTGKPNLLGENTTSREMLDRIIEQATGTKALI